MTNKAVAAIAALCLAGPLACSAQTTKATGPELDAASRQLARSIFQQLIEINTTDTPRGNVTTATASMRQRLLDAGFPASDLVLAGKNDRKQNLVATYRGKTGSALKPVLIICHVDVVEARREDWTMDPFTFIEKDGYFYGRGTQDMKSDDAAVIASFIRMKREGFVPDRDLILALTADEESGSANGVEWLLEHRPELRNVAFVLNPDSGGVTTEDGRPVVLDVEATEKLYADYRLTSTSPGGHSSLPTPDNPIYRVAGALKRLEASPFPVELNEVTRAEFKARAAMAEGQHAQDLRALLQPNPDPAVLQRLSAVPSINSALRTTCVATMIDGGDAPNALPGRATANVNCRILPGHSSEEVRQELIRIFADNQIKVDYVNDAGEVLGKGTDRKSAPPPPLMAAVFDPLHKVANELWAGIPILPVLEVGASDSAWTMQAGIPSYGFSGMAIESGDDRMHGRDERIGVESFYKGVEFEYLYLKAMASAK